MNIDEQVLCEGGMQELGRAVSLAAVQSRLLSSHSARGTASCTEAGDIWSRSAPGESL